MHSGVDIEECAKELAARLPDGVRQAASESAFVVNKIPLWAFILGHVVRSYENGLITSPITDPSWNEEISKNPIPESTREAECEQCLRTFKRKYYGQRFCSNECGAEAHNAAQAKAKAAAEAKEAEALAYQTRA